MMLSKPWRRWPRPRAWRFFAPWSWPGTEGMTPSALVMPWAWRPTPSFHLKLTNAGLVAQERAGRHLIYRAQFERMNALMGYLTENCCQGQACLPAQTTHCAC